jgi:hypothetical protein
MHIFNKDRDKDSYLVCKYTCICLYIHDGCIGIYIYEYKLLFVNFFNISFEYIGESEDFCVGEFSG